MDELIAFVRQQLDDDERVAVAAADYGDTWRGSDSGIYPSDDGRHPGAIAVGGYGHLGDQYAEHIARWDPARVLAEVEAKRRILDLHVPVDGYDPNGPVCSTCGEAGNPGDETGVVRWPCPTVRLLAQPCAGQPGWREEWLA